MRSTMCGGLAAVCGMAAAIGLADPARGISVTLTGVSPQSTVSISSDAGASFHSYLAGLDQFQGVASNPLGLREGFVGFCVDFSQHISIGGTYTDYALTPLENAGLPPMGATAADHIEELWGRHFASLHTETDYGAFQTSIWEILYDSDLSLSDGSFRMEAGSVRTLSQSWLDEIDGLGPKATGLYALASPSTQDMLVPTPGSAVLVVGGFAVGLTRRRRRAATGVKG